MKELVLSKVNALDKRKAKLSLEALRGPTLPKAKWKVFGGIMRSDFA